MKRFTLLGLLAVQIAAYDALNIRFFRNPDCTGDLGSGDLTDILGWAYIQPFQSFALNRSMTATEQLDFSASGDLVQCTGFLESVWNWGTSCRSVNTTTCVRLWTNTGPINNSLGIGWGWNGTGWTNITKSKN